MRNIPLTVRFIIQPERQNLYEEFSQQVLSLQEDPESPINYQLPSTWIRSTENKLRFLVPYNSDEYTSMVNCFDQTMKGIYTSIIRIERIQNQRWFLQYQVHRQEFNKRLATDTERLLYHGCSQSAANLIIEDCFNRSFAGAHGRSLYITECSLSQTLIQTLSMLIQHQLNHLTLILDGGGFNLSEDSQEHLFISNKSNQ
ncbi:unnamed protein product [Rotaria sordida]|uniref:PARP catalytic domain-containing protein n=1 Tax=Rotaria sordida TaxID=392033 RepID=A0A814EHZ9_9BILA|nr:unnamed protein product [Rotaria sordida]